MRHLHRLLPLLAAPALGLAAAPALAQDASVPAQGNPAPDAGGDSITIGAAGVYLPDYEGSNDYNFTAAPGAQGSISGFSFQLIGNRLSVDLIPNEPGPSWDFQAGPIAVLDLNRTRRKSIDDDRVKALGSLDTGIEVGGYVGIGKTGVITSDYDKLSVSVSYRKDVNGASHGSVWQPSINYFTPLSRQAAVGVFASAEHASSRYADYYYSVTPTGTIASGLPTYSAGKGWKDYSVGALGTVALTGDLLHGFKLVGGVTYERLLNDFGDSPLVSIAGRRSQWLGALGLAYTF